MKTAYERAKAYLDKLPPAISGAGGHKTTFRAACELVRFGLGDSEAMSLLADFNRRCRPPWTEKELAHKLSDARRAAACNVRRTPATVPPVRLVWKVARTIQAKPESPPQTKQMSTVARSVAEVQHRPWITKAGDLVIPFDSPEKYHWWKGRQPVALTRAELKRQTESCLAGEMSGADRDYAG